MADPPGHGRSANSSGGRNRRGADLAALSDDDLVGELSAMLAEADRVPPHLLEAAKAAFTWHTVDSDLAELLSDTSEVAVRISASPRKPRPRILTFKSGETLIVVQLTVARPSGHRMLGQISRGGSIDVKGALVEVRHSGGTTALRSDRFGRFALDEVPPGPLSLACDFGDGPAPVVTSWVTI